jgi:hypothetical protein
VENGSLLSAMYMRRQWTYLCAFQSDQSSSLPSDRAFSLQYTPRSREFIPKPLTT